MRLTSLVAAAASVVLVAASAQAQLATWNERTILKFDQPVMIPGKVLQPGTYVFRLESSKSDRNIVQIYKADPQDQTKRGQLVATALTVPMMRQQPTGDVVLKFASAEGSRAPVALKGYFYPSSMYGHQFVYTDREARDIARNTHTLVLSHEVRGTDLERGTLHNMNENGEQSAWRQEPAVARQWAEWVSGSDHGRNARDRDRDDRGVAGTSGHADRQAATDEGRLSNQDHAEAIEHTIDRLLKQKGNHVSIDRQTLEQIRMHAKAIEHGGR